jgi:hypothetical protein
MQGFLPPKEKTHRPRAAEILQQFIENFPHDKITLADVMNTLGHRAFGAAIFIFALANLLIANIPGISTILGIPIILIAMQLMMGSHRPWLPKSLAEKEFDKAAFQKVINRTVPVLKKIEVFIKPRLLFLSLRADRFLGLICLLLGLVLALPIVFGNWLPSWALAFIALGMIERDGFVILIGMAIGIAAIAYAVAFYTGFAHLLSWIAQ